MGRIAAVFASPEAARLARMKLRSRLHLSDGQLAEARLGAAGQPEDGRPLLAVRLPIEQIPAAEWVIRSMGGRLIDVPLALA